MEGKDCDQNMLRMFQHCYKMCCKTENLSPLKNLLARNNGHSLDFCIDRIKYSDWAPIFIALSDDLSLHYLVIRCRTQSKHILENVDTERLARNVTKSPVILSKFMLGNLVDAIAQCVSQSPVLNVLQLEGLPLPAPYLDPLAEALTLSQSLRHINLHGCQIGDSGCQKLCMGLRSALNVVTLKLSECNLTSQGAVYMANLIKFLKIYRYSENWKQTLRYQNPDLDSMCGLRHVTLSENPDLGDSGLLTIIEVLMDDLWIKAIELQQCGLTESIVKNCIQFLEFNSCLRILDLRFNVNISMKSLGTITMALRKNENSKVYNPSWCSLTAISSNTTMHKDSKFIIKNKSTRKSKLPFQSHNTLSKNDENKANHNEAVTISILKEQLKQEISHRKELEELNEKLLQQVKELKTQQIAHWKSKTNDHNSRQSNPKHMYTINLNDTSSHRMPSSKKSVKYNNKNERIGDGFHTTPRETNNNKDVDAEKNSNFDQFMEEIEEQELKHKLCTGADILEKLLELRYGIPESDQDGVGDRCNNEYSSDSSRNTQLTVRYVEKKKKNKKK